MSRHVKARKMVSKRCQESTMHRPVFEGNLKRGFSHFTHAFWIISVPKALKLCLFKNWAFGQRECDKGIHMLKESLKDCFSSNFEPC